MTETTASLPLEHLTAPVTAANPGRGLLTAIAWVFAAIGWLAGAVVRTLAFAGRSVRYGWWRGLGLTDEAIIERIGTQMQAQAQQQAAPPRPDGLNKV